MTMEKQKQGGFLIARIHQLAGRIFTRMLKEHGIDELNPAQGRIMFVLWRHDEIPIYELAKRTSLGKSTLTSMLNRLENTGFIKRIHSKDDRRTILIKRTEKDKAFQDLYVAVSQQMTKLFYNGFSKNEIERFEEYLKRILDNLTSCEHA